MSERSIRRRAPLPAVVPEMPAADGAGVLRKLPDDEAAQFFPSREPDYDYASLLREIQPGEAYTLKVPDGFKPRTFYMRLLACAREQFNLRLHLAKGTGGSKLDASGILLFQADRLPEHRS